jgi:fructose-1,6-bisphosphatase/inositol monophosphatase family enzyme
VGVLPADLAFAFTLADAADAVARYHFRSEAIRTTTKTDGTPVSQVDLAVEQAMLALVRDVRPGDAVVGEEVGPHAGTLAGTPAGASGWRWVFDGIDGTHNYAAGRPGWSTIIAAELDGEPVLGLVSAPLLGRRWWATADGGAWSAASEADGSFDQTAARRLRCTATASLDDASVIVTPFEGFLLGWRNEVPKRFTPPPTPRSQCFALDAVMVATGELDVAIITLGGVWDFAATSLIVSEAGGAFRDAWGGTRLDTATGVFANEVILDQVLAVLADMRPPAPDVPRLAKTVSTPIGGNGDDGDGDGWRRFGIASLPSMSARTRVEHAPPLILDIVDERADHLAEPFVGVTTDGIARRGLRSIDDAHVGTSAVADAAAAFLQALTPEQRGRATFALDAAEWRMWINVHMNHFRHGVMLEDLAPPVRELGLDLLRATMSARGFHQARSIMRLNELLAELTGDRDAFGEWPYFISVFGSPDDSEPWGWQIDGHHLCVNAMVFDGRIVMTPTFMGAEPRRVRHGPVAGTSLFDPEEALGLDLIRSFDASQRGRAIVFPSIHPDDIAPSLQNLFDGRMQAGAFHDNLVAPYQGVAGIEMSDAQRRVLRDLAATYAGWHADAHAAASMREVESHLDETWFSWYGGTGDDSPFYYRVHSPVILIEFDHHPGVAFDNDVPSRHHVHTVVRTPNGGDYGADLLREHHARFDHSHGRHDPH